MKPLDFINSPKEDFERHILVCKIHIELLKIKNWDDFTKEELSMIHLIDDILINVIPAKHKIIES